MPKVDTPGDGGVEQSTLSEEEERKLELAIGRGFEDTRSLDTQTVVQKFMDYEAEIFEAAEIAKAQFDRTFDGMSPGSGKYGVDVIHSGYFGYDSWDNAPELTAGETHNWIDNAAPDNLNGVGGVEGPLSVGEPAVHIILGVGTYSPSPKISRINWRLNDQPRPSISTEPFFRNTDLQVRWLDSPVVLKEDDDVYAQVYADADGADAPYFIGLTFLESKAYRDLDPAQMAGEDSGNIATE